MPLTTLARNAAADAVADLVTAVSLHSADPGATGADELSGGAYARASTTGSSWTESDGAAQNNALIQFPTPTASWGSVTHFAIHGANGQLGWGPLTATHTVGNGDTVEFAVGALQISIPAS